MTTNTNPIEALYIAPALSTSNENGTISFYGIAGSVAMLQICPDKFIVRGVEVPQDAKEALRVYNEFRAWLAFATGN